MGRRGETRGALLLPAMVSAAGLVIFTIFAIALAPKTWIMIGAVLVLIATIIGGVAWILPILDDEDEDQP